jgi:energy-coupling factor transport system permease protein
MTTMNTHNIPMLIQHSPLRKVDPRAKLVLSIICSLAVMMPIERLLVFMVLFTLLLIASHLIIPVARQIWRLKYLLFILFIVDAIVVDLNLAITVTIRILLLAGVFTLFVSTTTDDELRLALEKLKVPFRYAFSLSIAFQSVELLQREWQAICEAQMARGIWSLKWSGLRDFVTQFKDLVALTVPAIVMTTRKAWAITEAACARGFDSPYRKPYTELSMKLHDWTIIVGAIALFSTLAFLYI